MLKLVGTGKLQSLEIMINYALPALLGVIELADFGIAVSNSSVVVTCINDVLLDTDSVVKERDDDILYVINTAPRENLCQQAKQLRYEST